MPVWTIYIENSKKPGYPWIQEYLDNRRKPGYLVIPGEQEGTRIFMGLWRTKDTRISMDT